MAGFNQSEFLKKIADHVNKKIREDLIPKIKSSQTEKIRKIYYPGYKAPFSSIIIEVDENENNQDGTEREIKQDELFPFFLKSNSAGWVYISKNVEIKFENINFK